MTTIAQSDSTYTYIEKKVRHLTACSSQNSLSSAEIQEAVNRFYSQDFPYGIKLDQMRSVYKFLTIPNVDRYPVDPNNQIGFRGPVYFEGIPGNFFKNRDQLYNLYPRYPTKYQQAVIAISGVITGIAQPGNPAPVTSQNHNLTTGATIQISNVLGMVQLNGNFYTITVVDPNTFTLDGVDNTSFGAYAGGGTWVSTSASYSFNLFNNSTQLFPAPNSGILSTQLIIGGIDINGNPIRIIDDGGAVSNSSGLGSNTTTGQLIFVTQNTVGEPTYIDVSGNQQPSIPPTSPLAPGEPPGQSPYPPSPLTSQYCGTVDYISTQINLLLPVPPAAGTMLNIWAATYQTGRPYNLLWWNNQIEIRPVPDNVYLCEIEVYQSPSQFMSLNDVPVLNQWSQYLAYGAALEILRDRQDMEGIENLMEGFKRQEALVLERQAVEELFIPNITLFNSTGYGGTSGIGWGTTPGF